MANEKDAGKGDKPAKKSKKKLIIILVAVLVAGGAGAYFMLGKSAPAAPKPGEVLLLEPITMNLTDGHYLKLKLALQATADAGAELDGSKALDIAISEFSNRTVAELSGNVEREARKHELKEKISEAYEGEVMDIYFTEFVMQ